MYSIIVLLSVRYIHKQLLYELEDQSRYELEDRSL